MYTPLLQIFIFEYHAPDVYTCYQMMFVCRVRHKQPQNADGFRSFPFTIRLFILAGCDAY